MCKNEKKKKKNIIVPFYERTHIYTHNFIFQDTTNHQHPYNIYNTMLRLGLRVHTTPITSSFKNVFQRTSRQLFHQSSIRLNQNTTANAAGERGLTWNDFLALRTRRRRVYVISSMFTAFGGFLVGWGILSNQEINPTEMIMGIDPAAIYGFAIFVCAGLGYLAGPSVGDIVFRRILIRNQAASFAKKNTEFLTHIKKNRPDPRNQSYSNPVTDYYGEKIGSLKDYRQWLRDGRAYRKKSENFL